jgi:hypothetical protein
LFTLLRGQAPFDQHIAKVAGMALEGDKAAVATRHEIGDGDVLAADLDADVRVGLERGDLSQQIVSHHRGLPLIVDSFLLWTSAWAA